MDGKILMQFTFQPTLGDTVLQMPRHTTKKVNNVKTIMLWEEREELKIGLDNMNNMEEKEHHPYFLQLLTWRVKEHHPNPSVTTRPHRRTQKRVIMKSSMSQIYRWMDLGLICIKINLHSHFLHCIMT
jgi:hypothetical protein